MLERLRQDLIGPIDSREVLDDRPTERYVTGILFPQGEVLPAEENDTLPEGGEEGSVGDGAAAPESVSLGSVVRPASIALSFAVEHEGPPKIDVEVWGARYEPFWGDDSKPQYASTAKWQRVPLSTSVRSPSLDHGSVSTLKLTTPGLEALSLRFRCASVSPGRSIVTVALVNDASVEADRVANQKSAFFQSGLAVRCTDGTRFIPRPSRRTGEGRDLQLLYRKVREYAVGHGCSADWVADGNRVASVSTTWLPCQIVPAMSAAGHPSCRGLRDSALNPSWLVSAKPGELHRELGRLPRLYRDWLSSLYLEDDAGPELKAQAQTHIQNARAAAKRMEDSIDLLCVESRSGQPEVLRAFRLAMEAMNLQRKWAHGQDLVWRPFQLGFQLVVLESLASTDHPDRELMDLLWFPTGGGKTEAYFGLIAFLLFHRRLRHPDNPDTGSGTAVLLRYTLRLLTIQQFQRAARLVTACEHLRHHENGKQGGARLGDEPFSIGLWVGRGATPNSIADARTTMSRDENPTARQLTSCPCCGGRLTWGVYARRGEKERARAQCTESTCGLAKDDSGHLPIWTVDDDIYAARPSVIIGTADKFTQIVRKPSQTSKLFGGAEHDPPDLVLQDELHLISGPLGSLGGLYEMAIDELCTRRAADGETITHRPKVIGSTATIRAAEAQVKSLFCRTARQFPPAELDAEEGFFALRASEEEKPGRLYVGVTTAGRSPKYALQALYASLLQSGQAIAASPLEARDPWWTLVGYFNSLRELGGSLVMLSDDVPVSVGVYARVRGEGSNIRSVRNIDELTSRKSQIELRDTLRELEEGQFPDSEAFDAVLATNMISVGVDVDRLGVMAVASQPKQMAEYIQATSRVGRQHPGLVVTLYNNNRARDRSHFESFCSWHQALYRDVEATSVTPLAPRARDKALHAALVALASTQIRGLKSKPHLTAARRQEIEQGIARRLVDRARVVDPSELSGFIADLQRVLDRWTKRSNAWDADRLWRAGEKKPPKYWMDSNDKRSLLMSAEHVAAHRATGHMLEDVFPTLNSLRNVEASSPFMLREVLPVSEENESDAD